FSDFRPSPRNAFFTPDKCSTRNMSSPPPSVTQCLLPVTRLTCDPTDRFPSKSHIPLLILTSTSSRSKLDRLIQYRRWREAMMDCVHPSKLPLSESFRKTLDSAVMEEWALHCWQPSKDMYVDSQGVWWSASYQEIESGDVPESLLGDGRLFSKEGLLDFTARLPYIKVGPLRFLHATYVLMAVACVTLGHVGIRLYHCGGDEYEYYCQEDDLECIMQMFAQSR
ncbi:unnamed protein product, partial [Candidula unifasciata]